MTQITALGNTYSDDGTAARDMQSGGHRKWLLQMLSDVMAQILVYLGMAATVPAVSAATVYSHWDTGIADADPGTGSIRGNNATSNLITALDLDVTDIYGNSMAALIDTFDASTSTVKGYITLKKSNDPTKWMTFYLTGRTAGTGYRKLAVAYIGQSGANPFAAGDTIALIFTRNGDAGAAGVTLFNGRNAAVTLISSDVISTQTLTASAAINPTAPTHIVYYDTSAGAITATLPAPPATGNQIISFIDTSGATSAIKQLILAPNGGNIMGQTSNATWSSPNKPFSIVNKLSANDWRMI